MSRWLALATEAEIESYPPFDSVTKPDKTPSTQPERGFCQVLSRCHMGIEEKPGQAEAQDFRHGRSCGGLPESWTGKIVSLEDWRSLTEWEKHGPDGRHWNGITRKWEPHMLDELHHQMETLSEGAGAFAAMNEASHGD